MTFPSASPSPGRRRRTATIPVVVAVVAALVAVFAVLTSRSPDADPQATPSTASSAPSKGGPAQSTAPGESGAPDPFAELVRRKPGDPLARGWVDAPVVMINYSDFQCPFCGKFARDTEPLLVDKYVKNGSCASSGATSRTWARSPAP
nr:thioredoxin domain-containing protein [Ornithinicoccus soli]